MASSTASPQPSFTDGKRERVGGAVPAGEVGVGHRAEQHDVLAEREPEVGQRASAASR